MPTGHMFHGPHFHWSASWTSIAALPFAIVVLAIAAVLVCQVIPWS
ncbi:MAG TPA: hypothetical protein VHZ26_18405 [Caulobacteraceae bacterium]|jgi:hypothetical protein|nr:hypothetical protein [Caulobacteraceae bacterium]